MKKLNLKALLLLALATCLTLISAVAPAQEVASKPSAEQLFGKKYFIIGPSNLILTAQTLKEMAADNRISNLRVDRAENPSIDEVSKGIFGQNDWVGFLFESQPQKTKYRLGCDTYHGACSIEEIIEITPH